MKDERLVIVTTRARADAFLRLLAQSYLGYTKDDGQVRELMKDAVRALEENASHAT